MPTLNSIRDYDITDTTTDGRRVVNVGDLVEKINDIIEALNGHNEALDEVRDFFDATAGAASDASNDVRRAT